MNQENNSNQPVNYDFITSQGGIEDAKKPKDKKLIIVIVLAVITLLMIVLLAVFTNGSVKESTQSTANQQIPEKHLSLISENKTQEALDMYANSKDIQPEYYQRVWVDKVFSMYDTSKCTVSNRSDEHDKIVFAVDCPLKNSDQTQTLTYEVNKSEGKIIRVSNVDET